MENKKIVMSLGGSLIIPNGVDVDFVKNFVSLIKEYVSKGYSFLIITGGGNLCRDYNESLKKVVTPSNEDLDWLGISVTRANAEFMRICFGDLAYKKVVADPDYIPETDKPVILGAGWKPGNSSDLAAVHAAKSIGSKKIVNLSNIDYVYDSDPKNNPSAKPIEKISWVDFILLFPNDWIPGRNIPFDPIASVEAQTNDQEVVMLNGYNFDNLRDYLEDKPFKGTVIR